MIYQPFDLLKLPRVLTKSSRETPVVVDGDNLFIGVPSSSIYKLTLRPPQVLGTQSVAPGTTVTAILATGSDLEGFATKSRGKFFLNLVASKTSANDKPILTTEVAEEISALYQCDHGNVIVSLSKNSEFVAYSTGDLKEIWRTKKPASSPVGQDLIFSAPAQAGNDSGTGCIVVSRSNSSVTVRTFMMDKTGTHLLAASPISNLTMETEDEKSAHFSFSDGILYYGKDHSITVYRLPEAQESLSFEIGDGPEISGLVVLPNNNVAIARGNQVELIDCTFQSRISTVQLTGTLKILSYSPSASAVILLQGTDSLIGLTITPTNGRLLESIGKGRTVQPRTYPLSDIFDGFQSRAGNVHQDMAVAQVEASNREVETVLASLSKSLEQKDGPAFAEIVTYLKDPKLEWDSWHESGSASPPVDQVLVYEESDRNADRRLITAVAEMAFLPRFKPYIPIGVAVYLLTHPLFPGGEPKFSDLLRILEKSDVALYHQAIVSLTGVMAQDLVLALLHQNEDMFHDAALRLQEDYGQQQILSAIREAFSSMRSLRSLRAVVARISRHADLLPLVEPFIDAMGLLAWDEADLGDLRAKIANEISNLEADIKAESAISDLFNMIGLDPTVASTPSAAELRKRQQKKLPSDAETSLVARHSIETLSL